jgi:hypothetical protein
MERLDLWFGKEAPVRKRIEKLGVNALTFRGQAQTVEYDSWVANKKQGPEPTVRYLNASVTVFDEGLCEHVEKIYASYSKKLESDSRDPRPHIHVIGRYSGEKKLSDDGKRYFVDFNVVEASPLIFGPLRK